MIRIDHLIFKEYVCNPLLNDLVIDETVSHMRGSMFAVVRF